MKAQSEILKRVVGKTIESVETCSDGNMVDVEFKFTDGTTISVLNSVKPQTQLAFTWSDRDEDVIREQL